MRTPFFLGIAGPSCSGKTALAAAVVRARSGAVMIPLDAYYLDLAALPARLRATQNFDHPRALDRELLLAQIHTLARGESVERPVYDFATHRRAREALRVGPSSLVVVEGLFTLYWGRLRRLLDRRVFLGADPDLCLRRRLARDVEQRGRDASSIRAQFEGTVRPMCKRYVHPTRGHADLVLRGEDAPATLLARTLACLPPPAAGSL